MGNGERLGCFLLLLLLPTPSPFSKLLLKLDPLSPHPPPLPPKRFSLRKGRAAAPGDKIPQF